MIDDFEVPGDSGYGFDSYGLDKSLTLDYVRPSLSRHDLRIFYPSVPSGEETGKRRGCAFVAPVEVSEKLEEISGLKKGAE